MIDHTEIVEYLLNEKCAVNITDMYGTSPLHVAAMRGYLDCVIMLVLGKWVRCSEGRGLFVVDTA